jgi:4-hydroxy-4-methyl-2-oxoglutarate aldolase
MRDAPQHHRQDAGPADNIVVRTGIGPDPAVVRELARLGVSTAHESMSRRGLMRSDLRPIYPGACIAGRAVTILTQAGDNLMLHAAIEQCRPGDVLVLATLSLNTDGMFGDMLATAARARGVIGLVTEAGVRDVASLTQMRFPVWARAISAQGTVKATGGSVNVPVVVGGIQIMPGDVVVADDDGVLAIPLQLTRSVAQAAALRAAEERHKRARLARGELSLDMYHLRDKLSGLGVRYVDGPEASGNGDPEMNGASGGRIPPATAASVAASLAADGTAGRLAEPGEEPR